jgi:TolB-like protein/Tfp pilus assembly protein PilF
MKKLLLSLVFFTIALTAIPQQKRLALVIGNGNYIYSILANPENDARDMESVLKNLGFIVIKKENLDRKSMNQTIEDFGNRLKNYDVGLFYYAGHGIQSNGFNYLIPVDASLKTESDVDMNCVRADKVLGKMEDAKCKMNIVILDACRDNPYERSWTRAARGRGLATMNAPVGSIIGYSTAPGMTASDGSGKNSPYTSALLTYISEPDLTIEQMFKKVRTQVINKSNGQQQPWESTNMTGDFYFAGGMVNQGNAETVKPISNIALNNPDGTNRSMPEKSIAVLPFENYTGNPENEAFVDGQWNQLSNDLSSISSWIVKSRSALKYKGSDLSIPQIANELGVDYIVEGSVLGSGDTVRILIRVYQAFPDEKSLMAQAYDKDKRHILNLHSDVTREIAQKIKVTLTPQEENNLKRNKIVNPEAYDAYLKGMFNWRKLGKTDLEIAMKYFELAREKDPEYALAYMGIGSTFLAQAQMGYTSPEEAGPKGLEYVMKSLEMDSTSAEAHYMMACANTWILWDWKAGESEFKKAIALNPNFPDAHAYYSNFLFILHRPSEGMDQIELALKLDPFNSLMKSLYANCLIFMGKYSEASDAAREALQTSPNDLVALSALYEGAFLTGRYQEAIQVLKMVYSDNTEFAAAVDSAFLQGGHIGAFNSGALTLERQSKDVFILPFMIADLYYLAGNDVKAIELIEKSYEIHDQNLPYISAYFKRLYNYPRFIEILKKMNLP